LSSLALLGGRPVRERPFASWPVFDDAERIALNQVLESGIWGGYSPAVQQFEASFAKHHECRFGVSTCNGTLSLEAALHALGIGANDEVIVPPITFVATATAVLRIGAVPVFADIDPRTYNFAPAHVDACITKRTRAIIPVHFGGNPADLDALIPLAHHRNLAVLEDCAHAHGASWKGRKVGSFGDISSFSFQQSKNLTAGEGGILVTNNEGLAAKSWTFANQGRVAGGAWYQHDFLGTNLRLTGLQAAVLNAQLARLPEHLERRARNAEFLTSRLQGGPLIPPAVDPRVTAHGFHLYILRVDTNQLNGVSRDQFAKALLAEGIPGASWYPYPIYRNKLFTATGRHWTACPEAERMCQECFWLSSEVLLADTAELEDVVRAVEKVANGSSDLLEHAH
jgi:dTDP-4-amino-4,6-dideoxygalactose transaminase